MSSRIDPGDLELLSPEEAEILYPGCKAAWDKQAYGAQFTGKFRNAQNITVNVVLAVDQHDTLWRLTYSTYNTLYYATVWDGQQWSSQKYMNDVATAFGAQNDLE